MLVKCFLWIIRLNHFRLVNDYGNVVPDVAHFCYAAELYVWASLPDRQIDHNINFVYVRFFRKTTILNVKHIFQPNQMNVIHCELMRTRVTDTGCLRTDDRPPIRFVVWTTWHNPLTCLALSLLLGNAISVTCISFVSRASVFSVFRSRQQRITSSRSDPYQTISNSNFINQNLIHMHNTTEFD